MKNQHWRLQIKSTEFTACKKYLATHVALYCFLICFVSFLSLLLRNFFRSKPNRAYDFKSLKNMREC